MALLRESDEPADDAWRTAESHAFELTSNSDESVELKYVALEAGDKVPADAVFVRGNDVQCDESALTGETDDLFKDASGDPFLLSGCEVKGGSCVALVIAVGEQSRWGRIKAKLAGAAEKLKVVLVDHPKPGGADRVAEAFQPAVDLAGDRAVGVELPVKHVGHRAARLRPRAAVGSSTVSARCARGLGRSVCHVDCAC